MASAADHIYALRVGTRSTKNYMSKINTIKAFLISTGHQDASRDVIVPLSLDVIKHIFGWLSTNTQLPNRNKRTRLAPEVNFQEDVENNHGDTSITISPSCMQGYKSALRWYYLEKQVTMDASINAWIDTFITGYKKSIAN